MSEGTEHIETNGKGAEVSGESAEYTDLIVEPIDFGEIKDISDRRAFYGRLLSEKSIVLDTSKSKEKRLNAAVNALGLYRLRINYLSIKSDFEGIQETIGHYNGWMHHIEHTLQTLGSMKNPHLLKVSGGEISQLEKLASEIKAYNQVKSKTSKEPALAQQKDALTSVEALEEKPVGAMKSLSSFMAATEKRTELIRKKFRHSEGIHQVKSYLQIYTPWHILCHAANWEDIGTELLIKEDITQKNIEELLGEVGAGK